MSNKAYKIKEPTVNVGFAKPCPVSESATITLTNQGSEAADQLLSNYLINDPIEYTIEDIPFEVFTQPVETPAKPVSPSTASKNMDKMKEIYLSNKPTPAKRKRVANITPTTSDDKRTIGWPTRFFETLIKIANESHDKHTTSSKELVLFATDGSEKKRKTILTRSQENIACSNLHHYTSYEYITDARRKALDTIKEQKDMLDKLIILEKIIETNMKNVNTVNNS
jgi:hypothetical protein